MALSSVNPAHWEQLALFQPTAVRLEVTIWIDAGDDTLQVGYWAYDEPGERRVAGCVTTYPASTAGTEAATAYLGTLLAVARDRVIVFP